MKDRSVQVNKMADLLEEMHGATQEQAESLYSRISNIFGAIPEDERADSYLKLIDELTNRGVPFSPELAK